MQQTSYNQTNKNHVQLIHVETVAAVYHDAPGQMIWLEDPRPGSALPNDLLR